MVMMICNVYMCAFVYTNRDILYITEIITATCSMLKKVITNNYTWSQYIDSKYIHFET